jgi:hypothetical protein
VNQSDLPSSAVAELQGLYGAFSFPERLLQKIWLRGNFDRDSARTSDGRRLQILHQGKWNLLGGPDFRGARLRLDDGPEITGDVEVHLHAGDWEVHGHVLDRAYDAVVLHVVLFPPDAGRPTKGANGRNIPVLVLLPLLHHALEEFAAEEAVEVLADRASARLPDELGLLPPCELDSVLHRHAETRWRQKVHFARLRLHRLGWVAACHHAALEILGYRFNRAPMLRVAARWPLALWEREADLAVRAHAAEAGSWSLQGVRPANQPHHRLHQYSAWVQRRGDWPGRLLDLAAEIPSVDPGGLTREVRRTRRLKGLHDKITREIGATNIAVTRLNTLICDGFLPLLAAQTGVDCHGVWHHWFAGDLPPMMADSLRQLGVFDGRSQPACHGPAQGLLGWLIDREARGV